MSTVGLTKAQERALRSIRDDPDNWKWSNAIANTLFDAGLFNGHYITPRGHAALAAPKMTQKEYWSLEAVERDGACFGRALIDKGWIERDSFHSPWRLSTAGRTALNNVRAALGSEDYKENMT